MANDLFSGVKKVTLDAKKDKKSNSEAKAASTPKAKPETEFSKKTEAVLEPQKENVSNTAPIPEPVKEQPKEDPQPRSTRGRKPLANPMERDYVSVNVGDGIREDLEYLCRKHAKQSGKKSVGLGTYIRFLIEQDIASNQKYLKAVKDAEAFFE